MENLYNAVELGARIKHTRINRSITQEKLSEEIGISTSFLYGIESGIKKPSLDTLVKIAVALDESLDYFVFGQASSPTGSEAHIEVERMLSSYNITTVTKVRDILKLLLPMLTSR
jgi:transcriptional regulator with XRE-family HTH domain